MVLEESSKSFTSSVYQNTTDVGSVLEQVYGCKTSLDSATSRICLFMMEHFQKTQNNNYLDGLSNN